MCHSDKFFQVKIKHFSYYKTGDFTIYDFNYKKDFRFDLFYFLFKTEQ
jgi:hypothetical protein